MLVHAAPLLTARLGHAFGFRIVVGGARWGWWGIEGEVGDGEGTSGGGYPDNCCRWLGHCCYVDAIRGDWGQLMDQKGEHSGSYAAHHEANRALQIGEFDCRIGLVSIVTRDVD